MYRGDAHLDATVPNWWFTVDGAAAIGTEYGRWFAHPGRFSELHRTATADGEVVEYTLRWTEDGTPHAAHHVHVLTVDRARDRIATDRVVVRRSLGRRPARSDGPDRRLTTSR